jgi:hypothetical protein
MMERTPRLTVEDLLDRIDLLERQVKWLCSEIPRIGIEYEEDFVAWSYCPSREVALACIYKMQAPDSVCAECWKKASRKAVENQQSSQPEKA